jgi:hypothetical protein
VPCRRSSTQRVAITVLAVLVTAGACTGTRPELAAEPDATTTTTDATTTTTTVERTAEVAEALGEAIDVYADATTTEPATQLTAAAVTSAPGIPMVFLVKDSGDERVEVYLPTEPSGSTGWVAADEVRLSAVSHRVEVDVAARRLRVYEDDQVVVDEPAGIGPDRPVGGEGAYLTELVQPPEDDGPYGTYAYGVSGSPLVREGLEDGSGVVGIHGTDDADLVGTEMPRGSIAVAAEVLARLVDEVGLPLGTPLEMIG